MKLLIETLILFVITFILVFVIYEVLFVREYKAVKKGKKVKRKNKTPVEVRLLEQYYKVDISKLNYGSLLTRISLISSFDISLIVTISCIVKIGILRILIALVVTIPIIHFSYLLLSKILKRKIEKIRKKESEKDE